MGKIFTVADLRPIMQALYPEVEDDGDDHESYEHPMTAVGLVLLSAAIMGTAEAGRLTLFTGYSREFISAITLNMQNNQLWVNSRYETSSWLSSDGTINDKSLFDHIEVGCGMLWMPAGNTNLAVDPCKIYWDERSRT